MHAEAYEFVRRTVEARGPFHEVAEIGGRDVNGSVRPLFGGARYTSIDLRDGPGVDVVADAAEWDPWDENWFGWGGGHVDCVVCCEVLEHAENAPELVAAALRWLQPGGTLIVTCATDPRQPHSAVDGELIEPGDEYYLNVKPGELRRWLDSCGSSEVAVDERRGDLYAVAVK